LSLRVVPVSKCLDKKLMMLGYEMPDLLAIFLVLSTLNFLFGQTQFRFFLVWLPTISLAALLRFGKRGKPDGFLLHWLRYQMKPGVYSAFRDPSNQTPPPRISKNKRKNK
jgi:hypothetical protein